MLVCQSVHHWNNAAVDVELDVVSGSPADPSQLPLGLVHGPRRAGTRPAGPPAASPPRRRGRRRAWTDGRGRGPRRRDGADRQLAAESMESREPVPRGALLC